MASDFEWDLTPYDVTCGSNKLIYWKCNTCGHEWEAIINGRSNGYKTGCPECSESKGEKRCIEILTKYNIYYDIQYTFNDLVGLGGGLLKFDFAVFGDKEKTKLRLLIEYDGEFHYKVIKYKNEPIEIAEQRFKKQQYHDKRKNNYCNKNDIIVIRIPYWDFNNIEEILIKCLKLKEVN